jgi:CheY-like chemotaxis protein
MAHQPIRVLLVEDNPGDARLLREMLVEASSSQFELTHVGRLEQAFLRFAQEHWP